MLPNVGSAGERYRGPRLADPLPAVCSEGQDLQADHEESESLLGCKGRRAEGERQGPRRQ